ncbi:MAG: TrmJ/YjtD family RNA methyltransferase [archaeon]
MKNVFVVLLEFQNSGNIGAIARSMKNFNLTNLILINPKCNHLEKEGLDRATHAKDVLKKAKVLKYIKELETDYIVGSTAKLGSEYNIPRSPLTPKEFSKVLPKNKVAIMIGRENSGLTNEEVSMCDFIVSIPTSKDYPTMNASHAATIIFYELFQELEKNKVGKHIRVAEKKDKEVALQLANEALDRLKFSTEEKKNTQKTLWKKIIGKSFLTKREIFALYGFFKKIK